MVADLQAAARAVKARHPDLPLYVVGESMGGAVALVALAERKLPEIDGAVLSAPAVWGRAFMSAPSRGVLWLLAHTIPWYPLNGQGLGRLPSDNIPMLIRLSRDKLMIHETRVDAVKGLVDLMDEALADSSKLDGPPVLMLYGLNDEIVPESPVIQAMRRMPKNGRNRAALYSGGYHMLLRDLRAERVWQDIAAWIGNPRAGLPSGADARADRLLARGNESAAKRD
jgi:alpha-beta hydrolase superfamily lysophospholipase